MSEVQRFWSHEASNIRCVREADFDRVTSERDAALGREAALRLELEEMVRRATAALSNLSFTKNELNDTREAYLHQSARLTESHQREAALQALLTAADERNDTATSLIQRIVANFDTEIEFHEDVEPNDLEHDQVLADMRVFLGALKPAEPAKDEHVCTGCGSKGWTANCAECVPY